MFKQKLQELTMLKDKLLLKNEMIKKEKANRIIDALTDVGLSNTLWWFEDQDKDCKTYLAVSLETLMDGLHNAFTHLSTHFYTGVKNELIITIENMYEKAVSEYNKNNNIENCCNVLRIQVITYLMTNCNLSGNDIDAAADINAILADLVINEAAGDSGRDCTVDLSGGTNAAPTGQGVTDVGTLTAAGWTVTTN